MTNAVATMPRNDLIGVRFSAEELELLDRLVAHFTATHPGVKFNRQMAIKAAVARAAADALPPPAPHSRPRVTKTTARKR